MNRRFAKRLKGVEQQIATQPISGHVLQPAVEAFRETGELPNHDRLAAAVLRVARDGYMTVYKDNGSLDWGATIQAAFEAHNRGHDHVLNELYDEAIYAPTIARNAARMVLRLLRRVTRIRRTRCSATTLSCRTTSTSACTCSGFPNGSSRLRTRNRPGG